MREAGRTPWDVLGLAEGALYSEIKRAFLRRARATHPDVSGGDAEAFREVLAAFEILERITPKHERPVRASRRTPYDSWLSSPRPMRQWADEDPLLNELKADSASRRGVSFAAVLGVEIDRLHLQAA